MRTEVEFDDLNGEQSILLQFSAVRLNVGIKLTPREARKLASRLIAASGKSDAYAASRKAREDRNAKSTFVTPNP